jgi:hypothetical protein
VYLCWRLGGMITAPNGVTTARGKQSIVGSTDL